jgi:putative ABC transport system permease protein
MFFGTYLLRELRRRMRQSVFIALGLALGVGLVVTVAAASAGVKNAEAGVLDGLYGVGTDVTVTGPALGTSCPPAPVSGVARPCVTYGGTKPTGSEQTLKIGRDGGTQICQNGNCANAAGRTYERLATPYQEPFSASEVAAVARLRGVRAATGVLTLVADTLSFQAKSAATGGASPFSGLALGTFTVDGVPTAQTPVGPLAAATISSGHRITAADADANVAVVDSGYAAASNLRVGSAITIRQVRFTVIGIARQPQGTSPPDVYIPLARAQALGTATKNLGGSLTGDVNLIYVTAASAADIPAVQHEISALLPDDTVTAPTSLASQVTGSLSSAARLARDLGTWVSVLVLIAAFAVASLLTMAAVSRRSAEFGALKALGWRTRRIIAQVLGESLILGIAGAAVGIGLGYAGAAIITAVAPTLSATAPSSAIGSMQQVIQAGGTALGNRPVVVPLSPSVTTGVIALAVMLAIAGGLLAGALGAWRIARLRPADALTLVA